MDFSLEHHRDYIGRPIAELPTPSLIVSLPIVERNIAALHKDVETLGIDFRPHVKTLKVGWPLRNKTNTSPEQGDWRKAGPDG